jgi:glycosyltransferase involved in cell wall biosynthesis
MPRRLPLIVGSEEIAQRALEAGHTTVALVEPPVDVQANAPWYDPGSFRADYGLDATPLLTVICRLAYELKLEGLLSACDVVGRLAADGVKVQLAIVGDGPARREVEEAAAAANAYAGRRIVVLTGEMKDPRPAYAAADIVLGMGGSALRGMAFGKPLVVQGERGFWALATPESAALFLRQGWYGIGSDADGRAAGVSRLEKILRDLLDDRAAQAHLGQYGRALVVERFSLEQAGARQEKVYVEAMEDSSPPSTSQLVTETARVGVGVFRHKAVRKWRRWRGKAVASDDFNAVASTHRRSAK